ncbi:MAG: alpha/beta hydrolase [Deltaproteobacteria bacterium]|nr:alpha/beta hydrolase [Deltaproteobacteria bacterium]MBU51387.1 alpha/beta hydrolase [Deltaproteobacteria bacterium]|tara:strand:- start:8565 stop:9371 length:807 start_codon:yes stop_codon:yes gene_type:complete
MPIAHINDIDIYYERKGQGPPLLAIMGTRSDLRAPTNFFMSPIAQDFDVLLYDQRGMGQSSKPDRPYTMQEYAEDALQLLDFVGWSSCRLLGISFGGMVAQEVAIRAPERVDALVLACTSSGGTGTPSYPIHQLPMTSPEALTDALLPLYDSRITDDWIKAYPRRYQRRYERLLASFRRGWDDPVYQRGFFHQLEARATHDTHDRLHKMTCPTLVCGGRYDQISPPANLQTLAQSIPHATLEWFDGGHLFMMEDPRSHITILDFLSAH